MKLQKMADTILKKMVQTFSQSGNVSFDFDYFLSLFPDKNPEYISAALKLLENDELVSIFYADGIAYNITLLPVGIRNCEEDTMLKKGYQCIKEIRELIG